MAYFPMESTKVPVSRSMNDISEMLRAADFETVGTVVERGQPMVYAEREGIRFIFRAQIDYIFDALKPKRNRFDEVALRKKAERIAWRLLHEQVKAACDLVKYEIANVVEVFAGFLVYPGKAGRPERLADVIMEQVQAGGMRSESLVAALPAPSKK